MIRSLIVVGAAGTCVVAACGSTATRTPAGASARPTPTATPTVTPNDILVRVESFRPARGDSALRAFVADAPPTDTGGDCTLARTGGSGALRVSAFFPSRTAMAMSVTLQFDSAGHLVTYGEVRNPTHFKLPPGASAAVRDSIMRQAQDITRSTTVSLNYAVDQGLAVNRGGGKPTVAIIGTVRAFERLQSLGDPAARMERVRKLCGV